MARHRCSAEEAFQHLRQASQHANIKLREVAAAPSAARPTLVIVAFEVNGKRGNDLMSISDLCSGTENNPKRRFVANPRTRVDGTPRKSEPHHSIVDYLCELAPTGIYSAMALQVVAERDQRTDEETHRQ